MPHSKSQRSPSLPSLIVPESRRLGVEDVFLPNPAEKRRSRIRNQRLALILKVHVPPLQRLLFPILLASVVGAMVEEVEDEVAVAVEVEAEDELVGMKTRQNRQRRKS
jgi:hypothetical protein